MTPLQVSEFLQWIEADQDNLMGDHASAIQAVGHWIAYQEADGFIDRCDHEGDLVTSLADFIRDGRKLGGPYETLHQLREALGKKHTFESAQIAYRNFMDEFD